MAFTNPTKVAQTPNAPVGTNPKSVVKKVMENPPTRSIAPFTKVDLETGALVDADNNWKAPETSAKEPSAKKEKPKANDRHEQWKAEQKAKREAREQVKVEKQVKSQALAKDLLQKGDLPGAAKALGMTPQEFILYAQNAVLSIPTESKKLTPEQKKAQEEESLRAARDREIQELKQWKNAQVAQNFIRDNISPVLADKDKFELINAGDKAAFERGIYEYMNEHYVKTCQLDSNGKIIKEGEVLNAIDAAETIEQQLQQAMEESLERSKGLKKFEKYFAKEKRVKEEAPEVDEEAQLGATEEPEEEEERDEDLNTGTKLSIKRHPVRRQQEETTPFWKMTAAEKAAYIRRHPA